MSTNVLLRWLIGSKGPCSRDISSTPLKKTCSPLGSLHGPCAGCPCQAICCRWWLRRLCHTLLLCECLLMRLHTFQWRRSHTLWRGISNVSGSRHAFYLLIVFWCQKLLWRPLQSRSFCLLYPCSQVFLRGLTESIRLFLFCVWSSRERPPWSLYRGRDACCWNCCLLLALGSEKLRSSLSGADEV